MKTDIQFVYNQLSTEQKQEVVDFWVREKALPEANAKQRVDEVVFIARSENQEIIGVSTIVKKFYEPIGKTFWFFRAFVGEKYRRQGIVLQLIGKTKTYLNDRFNEGENPEVIGILLKVQSPILMKHFPQATWPRTKFHYVGTEDGCHMRISYFDEAKIA